MGRRKQLELVFIGIRLFAEDIAEARRAAKDNGTRYQHVVRAWVRDGARRARRAKERDHG